MKSAIKETNINKQIILKMENAKKEFLEAIENKAKVLCAWIGMYATYDYDNEGKTKYKKLFELKTKYNEDDLNSFLELLNFDYDDGYGCQELYGYVWFDDGTWLDRYEYDGSEYWKYNKLENIPNKLKG